MTLKDIQMKLYEKLVSSGWGGKLKMFLLSDEFYQILSILHNNSQNNKRFTPIIKDMFRAFAECPYNDLKVVIVGQDPYPQAGVADGISFSCSYTQKVQPSLRYIFKEIEDSVYPEEGYRWDPDLSRWSKQGVLMLNTALTCEVTKIGSHIDFWKPFITHLFALYSTHHPGIINVFLGKKALEWHHNVPKENYKFFTTHPASAAYKKVVTGTVVISLIK